MADRFTGGCRCGAVRYESTSEKIGSHYCHCSDCQKYFGGPFGAGFVVIEAETAFHGEMSEYESKSDSGSTRLHCFCKTCGSPIGEKFREMEGIFVLAVGTLDDMSVFKPENHLWTTRKQPWLNIQDELPCFETQPEF